jgi:hypothetical protein
VVGKDPINPRTTMGRAHAGTDPYTSLRYAPVT